jgi:squalene-associated FAD-dependent desaturase
MTRRVHIIGAGMAGLSAALHLTLAGEQVTLYEAAPFAGGRCRSFLDRELGCIIDNGNHLVLSGNAAVHDYLYFTNALETMGGPGAPLFPFMDLVSGERWTVNMGKGVMPWWIFQSNRRVAGTSVIDYLSALKILMAKENDVVTDLCDTRSNIYRRFWEPLVVGALNTEPEMASAKLLASIFAQSFGAGGRNCIPLIPKVGLSETFITPCVELLKQRGTKIEFTRRLRSMTLDQTHVRALDFIHGGSVPVEPGDWVVLALPAWITREFLPEISVPTDFRSIISAHFRVDMPMEPTGFTGLVGGLAEWAFVKPGVISVTISCGERLAEYAVRDLAPLVWRDVAKLYDLDPAKVPQHRIFKEKYATFAATPEQNARRPTALTNWKNLALAGEWTATGLPSTIESAVRSGLKAAQVVMRWAD